MIKSFNIALLLLLATLMLSTSCGTPCENIQKDYQKFINNQSQTSKPHISLELPYDLANQMMAQNLNRLGSKKVTLKNLGTLNRFFSSVELVPQRLFLEPAPKDHIGLTLIVGVHYKGASQLSLTLKTTLKPEYAPAQGQITLKLRPENFVNLTPTISQGAQNNLSDAIYRGLPKHARKIISRKLIAKGSSQVIDYLIKNSFSLIKKAWFDKLGVLAEFTLQIPELPIRSISLNSKGGVAGFLQINIVTTLPVTHGLEPASAFSAPAPNTFRLRMTGSAAAEIGNLGIKQKRIPSRLNSKGAPDPKGNFTPGLSWQIENRPVKIHLWCTQAPCIQVLVGGTPNITLQREKIELIVNDGFIEEVKGPALLEIGAWFQRLWADAIQFNLNLSSEINWTVAKQKLHLTIRRAEITKNELIFDFSLGIWK